MTRDLADILAELRGRMSIFDDRDDCGASCIFVSVNDLRAVLRALPDKANGSGALADLEAVCSVIFDRWDKDMRAGKLLLALSGELPRYDPRVTRIREALAS